MVKDLVVKGFINKVLLHSENILKACKVMIQYMSQQTEVKYLV